MKRLKIFLLCAVLLCGCSGGAAPIPITETDPPAAQTTETREPDGETATTYSELLECRYFDEEEFFIYDRRGAAYPCGGEVRCGVVPHHLTAGHMISGFFKTAAQNADPETVVIVAPMHYPSDHKLCTSETAWATPWGAMETDPEITALFTERLGAVIDDEMLQHDHSASAHIPFARYYFPNAKSACLLVSPNESKDFPERLAALLQEIAELKSCLFVFSIDFSHYLSPEAASLHDSETLGAVLAGDTDAIERMTNDNVDTPYCLSAFVRLSNLLGTEITAADHSNTAEVLDYPYNEAIFPEGVTSYFVYIAS